MYELMLYLTVLSLLPPFSFYRTGPPTLPGKIEKLQTDDYRLNFENRIQSIGSYKTNRNTLSLTTPLYKNNLFIETGFSSETSQIFSIKYGKIGVSGLSKFGKLNLGYKGMDSSELGSINVIGLQIKTLKKELVFTGEIHNYRKRIVNLSTRIEVKLADFTNIFSITEAIAEKNGYIIAAATGYSYGITDFKIDMEYGKYAYDTLNFYNQSFKDSKSYGFSFGVRILPQLYGAFNLTRIFMEDTNIEETAIKLSYNW